MIAAHHETAANGPTDARPTRAGHPTSFTVVEPSFVADPALALLQEHQRRQITPALTARAERRLQEALTRAERGRPSDPDLLLRQVLTDLGITLALP